MKRKCKLILRLIIRLILYDLYCFPKKFIIPQSAIKLTQGNKIQTSQANHILSGKEPIPLDQIHSVPEYDSISNVESVSGILHFLFQNKAGLIQITPEISPEEYSASFAEYKSFFCSYYSPKNKGIVQPYEKLENWRNDQPYEPLENKKIFPPHEPLENWKIFPPHEIPENKKMLLCALRVKPGWRLWLKKRYFRNHAG